MRSRRALLSFVTISALSLGAAAQETAPQPSTDRPVEPPLLASCDVCLPTSIPRGPIQVLFQPGFQAGVDHQFTKLNDLSRDGQSIDNPSGEKIDSNATQFHFTYNLSPKAGFILSIPYHNRSYRKLDAAGGVESGSVSGIGDAIVRGRYAPVTRFHENSTLVWTVEAGMKLPTGSTRMLREGTHSHAPTAVSTGGAGGESEHDHGGEHSHHGRREYLAHEGHDHEEPETPVSQPAVAAAGHSHNSAVEGHDLTLGSGSVDGIIGTGLFYRSGDFYATAGGQYVLRSTGAAGYRYGDLLTWRVAPGYLFINNSDKAMGIQLNVSGEHHDPNRLYGERNHGYSDVVYVGPEVMAQGESLSLNLGLDLPVKYHAEGLTLAPDYRARFHFNWRF